MLLELWEWLTTPASSLARKSGLLYEAIALRHRAQRCAQNWHTHIVQCHAHVHQAMASLKKHDVVVVMGSGLLLEVPIDALVQNFGKVILIDMVHLKPVRQLAKQHSNIQLIEADLSGNLAALTNWKEGCALPEFTPPTLPLEQADLIISANLLSQLKQPAKKFLGDKLDAETVEQFQKNLVQSHWHWLIQLPGKKLIFSDVESQFFNANGDMMQSESSVLGPLPRPDLSWWWNVAPVGEIAPDFGQLMKMNAWLFEAVMEQSTKNLVQLSHYKKYRHKKERRMKSEI